MILIQIWNERKTNAWLWAELLLVFVALWVVVDWTYVNVSTWCKPLGFDIENTYLVEMDVLTAGSVGYRSDTETRSDGQDLLDVLDRLRRHPEVECVSYSLNSYPYCGGNSWQYFMPQQDTIVFSRHVRQVSPDFFRVFRYENIDGSPSESLTNVHEWGKLIVSSNFWDARYPDGKDLLGQGFYISPDTTQLFTVAAVTNVVRYHDFDANNRYAAIANLSESVVATFSENNVPMLHICLRVKDGTKAGFAERMLQESPDYNVGNVYIKAIESFEGIRDNYLLDDMNAMKNRIFIMAFLLINIFLGVVGTFWYRTQQRRGELGLRMALGASRRGLNAALAGEGLLLLTLAAVPALLVCFNIGVADLLGANQLPWGVSRFAVDSLLTFALLAAMILGAIWYPAHQAMKIKPADALHDE
jgi:putative ABC transport system permease protein